MIRVYGDLNFSVQDIKNLGERFVINFYTTAKSHAIRKTDADIVEGLIKLNKSELSNIGRGVLQYEVNNITADAYYDDGSYDSTYTATTNYFIISDIVIEEDENTPITEVIADIKNDINSLETNKQNKLTAGKNVTIMDNEISVDVDLSDYYTKDESDTKYATQVVVNEEISARITALRDVNTALETKAEKSEIPTIPTNVSAFNNDAGYLTQHQSLENYYTKSEVEVMVGDIESILNTI